MLLEPMNTREPRKPSILQFLLGVFVVWQLFFLFMSNFLPLIPHGKEEHDELTDDLVLHRQAPSVPPGQNAIEGLAMVTDRWLEVTGQLQGWSLFAPTFPPQAGFVVVELRWNDGKSPVSLSSRFEPEDPLHYFRFPDFDGRLFNFESRLCILPNYKTRQAVSEDPEGWKKLITERVRTQWKSIRAYLRWRCRDQVSPPDEMILVIHLYETPEPHEKLWIPAGPHERVLARWRPGVEPPPGCLRVEVCTDPISRRFEWIATDVGPVSAGQ
jgi:hypothetical protein